MVGGLQEGKATGSEMHQWAQKGVAGQHKDIEMRQETNRLVLFCLIMHLAYILAKVLMGKKRLQLNYPLGNLSGKHEEIVIHSSNIY